MIKKLLCLILSLFLSQHSIFSQPSPVNRQLFFLDDNTIEVTLTTDIKKLWNNKRTPAYQPANITMKFSDTSIITEEIGVKPRGIFRKDYCDMAALMLNFKNPSSPMLSPLKSLKLVGDCKKGSMYEELLLKEYLVYKIQNFLSNMSFRVRLLHVTYNDSKQKVKSYTQYAFLMEDVKDLAERNNCIEIKKRKFFTENTSREQMTFVNLFQYMIGNTDWSVPNYHNIKLIVPKNDTLKRPYTIPYDYDYSGFVNAIYAVPDVQLGIESVSERVYRGFPRNLDELQAVIDIFQQKKESIMYYIDHFDLCSIRCRKEMIAYLDEFYKIVANKKNIESTFIRDARTQ